MPEPIVVVESAGDWRAAGTAVRQVSADDYLTDSRFAAGDYHVINLCRGYRYQSVGYYCSLLAEARGHRVLPSITTLQDLYRKALYGFVAPDLEPALRRLSQTALPGAEQSSLRRRIWFGQCAENGMGPLARQLFEAFPAPVLEVELRAGPSPAVTGIRLPGLRSLDAKEQGLLSEALQAYLARGWRRPRPRRRYRYDLAILADPTEPQPPSDARALRRFVSAGRGLGLNVELIRARDFGRLAEFDGLFIRETTRVNHHTYRFARRAEQEGLAVIDDPASILRCANKVYLAELLAAHKLPAPRTCIFGAAEVDRLEALLGLPMVLKAPEGAFSSGVYKVDNTQELSARAAELLRDSELALAQEFLPTEFDWRVGVLDRRPLYVCQYLMARRHWQIVKHEADGRFREGGYRSLPLDAAPPAVLRTALRAANLIGDGLYGVDLKQTPRGVMVIEINDNPNIESGVEDAILGPELYRRFMASLLGRIERLRGRRG